MLVPLSLVPYFLGMSGRAYAVGALIGSCRLLWLAISFALRRSDERARRLFFGSISYLPCPLGDVDSGPPAIGVRPHFYVFRK
jgi:protoheme IX farnesyltransferase